MGWLKCAEMRARLPTKGLIEIGKTFPIQILSCYPNIIFLSRGEFGALRLLVFLSKQVGQAWDTKDLLTLFWTGSGRTLYWTGGQKSPPQG